MSNCWIEDFAHEGIAASGGDTLRIFNTLALNNDQGFEAGYTEYEYPDGPHVFIDHSVAVGNNVGLRIGDEYNWDGWTYRDKMTVTNSVLYGNGDKYSQLRPPSRRSSRRGLGYFPYAHQ